MYPGDLKTMLAIDALGAGDLRAFVTRSGEPSIGLSIDVEIKSGCTLRSVCGYGDNFADALADLWRQLTEMESRDEYLVINAGGKDRRAVRWNGAGFRPHYEPERA